MSVRQPRCPSRSADGFYISPASAPRRRSPSGVCPPASRNHCIRSWVSSWASVAMNAALSASNCASMSCSDCTTLSFAAATAYTGNDAMRPASRSTKASMSSLGSTRFTQPQRSAVAASTSSQLEGATPSNQSWESDRAARARDDPERDLVLTEDRVGGGESHVARQRQLAPAATDAASAIAVATSIRTSIVIRSIGG